MNEFAEKYGPWALVAGATEGIGEAYSIQLAAIGLNILMVARQPKPLDELAEKLGATYGIETRTISLDLAAPDVVSRLEDVSSDLDIGLVVYNAAASHIGHFTDVSSEKKMLEIGVNVYGPVRLIDHFAPELIARGKGGIILMSSIAGTVGSSYVATYAATKSFIRVLAEGLWAELKPKNIDVLACIAGATNTPAYRATKPKGSVPMQSPDEVVVTALKALGKRPVVISGRANKIVSFLFGRMLPKTPSVRIMSAQLERLYGQD
jgi:short-subunit dehydrogenase